MAVDLAQGRLERKALGSMPDTAFQTLIIVFRKIDKSITKRFPVEDSQYC